MNNVGQEQLDQRDARYESADMRGVRNSACFGIGHVTEYQLIYDPDPDRDERGDRR